MRKGGIGRVVVFREEIELPGHVVTIPKNIEAIREENYDMEKTPISAVYVVGVAKPFFVHHEAKALALQCFGHTKRFKTRNFAHQEGIYFNDDLISAMKVLPTGSEPTRAAKNERSLTVFLKTGREFNVIEKVDPAVRSLFKSTIHNLELPMNRSLKKLAKENR